MKRINLMFTTVVLFGLLLSCSNNEQKPNNSVNNSIKSEKMEMLKLKTKEAPSIEVAALESNVCSKRPIVMAHGAAMGSWDFEEYFMPYFFLKTGIMFMHLIGEDTVVAS